MKKSFFKVASLILAMLMLASAVTSCTTQPNGDESAAPEPQSSQDTTTETLAPELPLTLDGQTAIWREETDDAIEAIRTTPNMEINQYATVYYVSNSGSDTANGTTPATAWKTLDKLNRTEISSGSYVCFERGGLWRGQLVAKEGVTYTAYGEGDKPKIYGSPKNAADPSLWKQTATPNIWEYQADWNDVGTLVFNEGEAHGIKCIIRTESTGQKFNNTTGERFNSYADLKYDLHFWHDYKNSNNWKLYLYSEQNPGERFTSIELCDKGNIVDIPGGVHNVTVDNLCLKYTGSHGVGASVDESSTDLTFKNLTVTNCEIAWIGGSIQSEGAFGRNYATRYGNGVEIWGGCDGFTVTDNYIYQIYDAAITQQYTEKKGKKVDQLDIRYSRNVIEYANYSIEYWLKFDTGDSTLGILDGMIISDNYMWYAGMGFCEQRPDKTDAAHIKGWKGNCVTNNCQITGNLFYDTGYQFVQINPSMANTDGSIVFPEFSGNHFVGSKEDNFGIIQFAVVDLIKFTSVRKCLGENSDGTDRFWFFEED